MPGSDMQGLVGIKALHAQQRQHRNEIVVNSLHPVIGAHGRRGIEGYEVVVGVVHLNNDMNQPLINVPVKSKEEIDIFI